MEQICFSGVNMETTTCCGQCVRVCFKCLITVVAIQSIIETLCYFAQETTTDSACNHELPVLCYLRLPNAHETLRDIDGTWAGHGGTRAGHGRDTGGTHAGHGGTWAGHGGTCAGHGGTRAGHGGTRAGHGGTRLRDMAGHGRDMAGQGRDTGGTWRDTGGTWLLLCFVTKLSSPTLSWAYCIVDCTHVEAYLDRAPSGGRQIVLVPWPNDVTRKQQHNTPVHASWGPPFLCRPRTATATKTP